MGTDGCSPPVLIPTASDKLLSYYVALPHGALLLVMPRSPDCRVLTTTTFAAILSENGLCDNSARNAERSARPPESAPQDCHSLSDDCTCPSAGLSHSNAYGLLPPSRGLPVTNDIDNGVLTFLNTSTSLAPPERRVYLRRGRALSPRCSRRSLTGIPRVHGGLPCGRGLEPRSPASTEVPEPSNNS